MIDALSFALAIAASPFPIIPVIILLSTPAARRTAPLFALGWWVGILLWVLIAVVVGDLLDPGGPTPTWVAWVKVVGGAGLIVLAGRKCASRNADKELPGWLAAVRDATPLGAGRIGFLIAAVNPKIVLLAIGAGLVLGAGASTPAAAVGLGALFSTVAAAPVLLPVIGYLVAGERLLPTFEKARIWLERNNAVVMAVVLLVLGAIVLRDGMVAL